MEKELVVFFCFLRALLPVSVVSVLSGVPLPSRVLDELDAVDSNSQVAAPRLLLRLSHKAR